jgi:hypothetical protein
MDKRNYSEDKKTITEYFYGQVENFETCHMKKYSLDEIDKLNFNKSELEQLFEWATNGLKLMIRVYYETQDIFSIHETNIHPLFSGFLESRVLQAMFLFKEVEKRIIEFGDKSLIDRVQEQISQILMSPEWGNFSPKHLTSTQVAIPQHFGYYKYYREHEAEVEKLVVSTKMPVVMAIDQLRVVNGDSINNLQI